MKADVTHWCVDAADVLMLLMSWCCWCTDATDVLMLLICWCCWVLIRISSQIFLKQYVPVLIFPGLILSRTSHDQDHLFGKYTKMWTENLRLFVLWCFAWMLVFSNICSRFGSKYANCQNSDWIFDRSEIVFIILLFRHTYALADIKLLISHNIYPKTGLQQGGAQIHQGTKDYRA